MTHVDDEAQENLLEAIAEGDRHSLRVLYSQHAPWLTVRLMARCHDRELVEEVVQDTFVVVWRTAGRYAGSGTVAAWIWGIGIRRLIDRLRKRRPTPVPATESEPSAEERVLAGIEYGDVARALSSLSPELLAVLQATALDGLTTREASRLLGIPPGTVKTRLMRARLQLREHLA